MAVFVGIVRSERWAAVLLVVAAAAGLLVANSAIGPNVIAVVGRQLGFLTTGQWVTDGLLATFFFLAAIELKHELTRGELSSVPKAIVPAAAAAGGVLVPALLYLLLVHNSRLAVGWPIPTATDIAFALGILALVGRRLPPRVRALLLALAVLDDLIAIAIIAIFYTAAISWLPLVGAAATIVVFALLSRLRMRWWLVAILILLGAATWLLVALSGVHPTVAGVALGLAIAAKPGQTVRHALEPLSNGIVLPVFAFVATLVAIPRVPLSGLSPIVLAIVIALPIGKLVGITTGALIAIVATRQRGAAPPLGDILVVASLGGIGFTVSLLMNQLAWKTDTELVAEGTLAVLIASLLSGLIGAVVTTIRARSYR